MKTLYWFIAGLLVLILLKAARVYFIIPFPGSQLTDGANLNCLQWPY